LDRIAFEREEPMNQVDGCCQHGELLDKYCPECAKEDREAEDKEFKPKEGDRILVGWIGDQIDYERTYIYTDKRGKLICVDSAYEAQYREGNDYVAQSFPYAKPLPPKLPPEFVQGDPVIVCSASGKRHIRIVDSTTEDGHLMCYSNGRFSGSTTGYSHYKPFPGYNYGGRNVFEV
jgi:hypothetical protein